MAKGVREIRAKDFVRDLRSGMEEANILQKYGLSREQLQAIFQKLVRANALTQAELNSWLSGCKSPAAAEQAVENAEVPPGILRRLRDVRNRPEPAQPELPEREPELGSPRHGNDTFRLKLYGRMTGDPDAFCTDLAAVMGIDVQTAKHYLDSVPVALKEGLSEEKAERLRGILVSVGALCLVEPMNPMGEATVAERKDPVSPVSKEASLVDALLMRKQKSDNDPGLFPSRVKPSLLALLGTVIVLASVGFYLLTSTRSVRQELALNPPVERSSGDQVKSSTSISDEEALPAIKAQINYLESELETLFSQLTSEKAAFDLLVNTPGVEYDALQRKNADVQSFQEQIGLLRWQIRTLKKRAALIERTSGPDTKEGEPEPGQSEAFQQSAE